MDTIALADPLAFGSSSNKLPRSRDEEAQSMAKSDPRGRTRDEADPASQARVGRSSEKAGAVMAPTKHAKDQIEGQPNQQFDEDMKRHFKEPPHTS